MKTSKWLRFLLDRPRPVLWVLWLVIFVLSGLFAFLLRFEFFLTHTVIRQMITGIIVWVLVKTFIFVTLGLDRGHWRYASVSDLIRIVWGSLAASAAAVPMIVWFSPSGFPRSTFVLDYLLSTCGICAACLAARMINDHKQVHTPRTGRRTVIYGAGQAGAALLSELQKNPQLHYRVCGFIDDNRHKIGMCIQSVPVLGAGRDLLAIASRHAIEEALIAIPSADGPSMCAIMQLCQSAGLSCKTIPRLADIIESRALTRQIRDVAVEDLLARTPVRLDETGIQAKLEGAVVLVTGAGGSIGSELCRQIATFRPRAIVGYEVAETPLFEIDREIRSTFPKISFIPEVGSIQHRHRLAEVLERHLPSVLYHAAAYKHVPLMEAHIFEAVENNILGTANVALLASETGITDFVMISSDKAVRPTNIMGASKRIAEMVINSLQNGGTKFVSVRFGNVLGSNGSVIPIFKQQIAAGGPITITHPEVRRYFMTIPEAAQLVLQASIMGSGGEVFVLDMGQQIRIVDLARNLIILSGLRPDKDIGIEFTGLRPGEKLYEELSTMEENTLPTIHEKIKVFSGPVPSWEEMRQHLTKMAHLCAVRDARRLLLEIKDVVPEYNPSLDVLQRLITVTVSSSPLSHSADNEVPEMTGHAMAAGSASGSPASETSGLRAHSAHQI